MVAQIQTNDVILEQKLAELEAAHSWSPRVISKLETFIRTADDYSLFRVNPYTFAAEKGISEAEAIDLFLYSAKFGIFEMDWNVLCAFCPHVVESFQYLNKLHTHRTCQFCGSQEQAALDDYIQVTFTVLPQIRDNSYRYPESLSVEDFYYKFNFTKGLMPPSGFTLEGIIALLHKDVRDIQPKETQTFEFDLPPGRFEIIDVPHNALLVFGVEDSEIKDAPTQTTSINMANGKFSVLNRVVGPMEVASGPTVIQLEQFGRLQRGKHRFEIENQMDERARLWIIQYPLGFESYYQEYEPFLSGKKLLSTQTFRDLFRSEVIDTAEGIEVKDLSYLFTDLKGSTALYDRIGDAKAYYLVRQHFETLTQVIAAKSGAIVKTIGDAVMATFVNPADAVDAAITMIEKIDAFNKNISEELILKIGVHKGHSIAVAVNERLDYFGQSVNIASRIQGLADANEIYISGDVYAAAGVSDTLKSHLVMPEQVSVKGVSEKQQVYKIKVGQGQPAL